MKIDHNRNRYARATENKFIVCHKFTSRELATFLIAFAQFPDSISCILDYDTEWNVEDLLTGDNIFAVLSRWIFEHDTLPQDV